MLNNDILRRVRYALALNDKAMLEIFALGGAEVTREQLLHWLRKNHEKDFEPVDNEHMTQFLDGLITSRRGKLEKDLEAEPVAATDPPLPLTNNVILRKLRIALIFKEEDMLAIFQEANFKLSKRELRAFFRNRNHKHHRVCGDHVLRNFLQGLVHHFRKPDDVV